MYDLEVLVPMSSKHPSRVEDFKKYGLVNHKARKVLVNVLVSGSPLDRAHEGWPEGFHIEVVHNPSPRYVPNVYKFYTQIDPDKPRARWFMRVDDDSCTDVDGLVANLDAFYDWETPFHLGNLILFKNPIGSDEGAAFNQYKSLLGHLKHIVSELSTEVECGIMSAAALSKVLNNPDSRRLIEKRSEIDGGYFDCVVALASAMVKVFPLDCPFVSRQPLIEQFSLLGGLKNHIHLIARVSKGENLGQRCSYEGFILLTKVIENRPSETELSLIGKKAIIDSEGSQIVVELKSGYKGKIDSKKSCSWCEIDNNLLIMDGNKVLYRMSMRSANFMASKGARVPFL